MLALLSATVPQLNCLYMEAAWARRLRVPPWRLVKGDTGPGAQSGAGQHIERDGDDAAWGQR